MSDEDLKRYIKFLEDGSQAGLTPAEQFGLQKVDEQLLFNRIDYDEVLALRKGVNGGGTEVLEEIVEESIDDVAKPIIKGGSKTGLSDLPENVQNSFNRYEEAGWQGNVSGQTPGTNAGRRWANRKSQLPTVDANGNPITYREFDVNNYNGFSRDGERFIVGTDGSVWYTDSHYGEGTSLNGIDDFVQIK